MLHGLAVLLVAQLAGEIISRSLGLPLPGPVVGLVIIGLVLASPIGGAQIMRPVGPASDAILAVLGLLFVPAGVGVIQQFGLLGNYWLPIATTLVLSALFTMIATVSTFVLVKRLMGTRS